MQDVTDRKHDVQGGTETTRSKVKLLSLCLLRITYLYHPIPAHSHDLVWTVFCSLLFSGKDKIRSRLCLTQCQGRWKHTKHEL